ncbi:AMP-binding enzyme, partial [Streptomyces lasiicapitis]
HTPPAPATHLVWVTPPDFWGEVFMGVVSAAYGHPADEALAADILRHCEHHLAGYKRPKSVDFVASMPRDPNGKLYKRRLREPYWEGRERAM